MVSLTSRSNWNLEVLVFVEGGKSEIPEKNPRSKARTNNKLNPHETPSRTRVTEVGGEHLSTAPTTLPTSLSVSMSWKVPVLLV